MEDVNRIDDVEGVAEDPVAEEEGVDEDDASDGPRPVRLLWTILCGKIVGVVWRK